MTHSDKFVELIKIYSDIFVDAESFSRKLGYKRPTSVWNWIDGSNPNSKNRAKIADFFNLKTDIWIEEFISTKSFKKRIESGEFNILSKKDNLENIDQYIYGEKIEMLDNLEDKDEPLALFHYAKKLKSKNRAKEALEVIKKIEESNSSYKYNNHNQIAHLKAILLSHDTVQEWDRALDILKKLYSSAKYHLQEPEIVTLIASNYKRKALYDSQKELKSIEKIDVNLLVQAYSLYKEGYRLKDSQQKYYDAVNYAYIHNIIDTIEYEYAEKEELKKLYKELHTVWRIDVNSWWEVSSNAEFLMLLGDIDLAISKINYFLDTTSVDKFEIETSLRQLKIYTHLTKDKNGIKLYNHLKEALNYLKI